MSQCMWLYCSSIHYVVCQKYVGIILEICLFETEIFFLGYCVSGFCLISTKFSVLVVILLALYLWSWLEAPLQEYCFVIFEHVFNRNFFVYLITILNYCFCYSLLYTPNLYWVWEHTLWLIHTSVTLHASQLQINYWQQPSLDMRHLQGSMALVFCHKDLLWITLILVPGHLDAW